MCSFFQSVHYFPLKKFTHAKKISFCYPFTHFHLQTRKNRASRNPQGGNFLLFHIFCSLELPQERIERKKFPSSLNSLIALIPSRTHHVHLTYCFRTMSHENNNAMSTKIHHHNSILLFSYALRFTFILYDRIQIVKFFSYSSFVFSYTHTHTDVHTNNKIIIVHFYPTFISSHVVPNHTR